ncbi:hypothetical protein QTP70_003409 [Hemibagrus guttatus]|uniref:Sleeping Beauty transposase HTH domain-containing protein n=1 Tax=Hemibagrus guttatus TaxID=175788 RepID=A0AAE0QC69_9TELE|nr:hypothetical protein QTP70_003409 [Hemibagrus guttatus]
MRKKVIEIYQSGKGYKAISKAVGLPRTTVRAIIYKWPKHGTVENLPRSDRPTKITPRAQRQLIQEVTKDPTTTSKELQASLASVKVLAVGRLKGNDGLLIRDSPLRLREGQYECQRLSELPQDKISSALIQMYASLLSINGTEQLLPTGCCIMSSVFLLRVIPFIKPQSC